MEKGIIGNVKPPLLLLLLLLLLTTKIRSSAVRGGRATKGVDLRALDF